MRRGLVWAGCAVGAAFAAVALAPVVLGGDVPFHESIDLFSNETRSFEFEVSERRVYTVQIRLHVSSPEERTLVRKISGEPESICRLTDECGANILADFEIRSLQHSQFGRTVFRGKVLSFGSDSFTAEAYHRRLAHAQLGPGRYRLSFSPLRADSALKNIRTTLGVTFDSRENPFKE